MPVTVHKILIHGAKVTEIAPLPIGPWQEESQEATNKIFKSIREFNTRRGPLSFAIPVARHPDHFVVGFRNQIILVQWSGMINDPTPMLKRFNDIRLEENESIKCGTGDPFSGLWLWTEKRGARITGKMYSFHPLLPNNQFVPYTFPENGLTNGIVWHIYDGTKFYYIDAKHQRILSFSYDHQQRTPPTNLGMVFDLPSWYQAIGHRFYNAHAIIGRMTIDTKGRLWVPLLGGSHVIQVNPRSGEVMQTVKIPAIRVSACAFGGLNMNILYVSTLGYDIDEVRPTGDKGGKIFAVSNLPDGVRGHDARPFVVPRGILR
ncbi:regucalcin-like [Belonocnema kinseyi]|uniref:regucalcin-like n=1 Tax=Belonocnema kinseyi TaxID=2817044 RepID=UPI00143D87C1|nr:regucalcin-like [Belonocnema kinseyi]